MSRSSSIRARLTWSSLVSVVLIATAGGAGILGLVRSDDGLSAVTRVTAAVRQQMQGDMMHDALRADVLMALRLAPDAPAADRAAVSADLAEHAQEFRAAMASLRDLNVSPGIAAQLPAVTAAVDAYVRAAEAIVTAAVAMTSAPSWACPSCQSRTAPASSPCRQSVISDAGRKNRARQPVSGSG